MLGEVPLPGRDGKGTHPPARRRRRADGGGRTAPNDGRQQGDDSAKTAWGGRASEELDAAMVASRMQKWRRPKGGYGRHGDGVYFFEVTRVVCCLLLLLCVCRPCCFVCVLC